MVFDRRTAEAISREVGEATYRTGVARREQTAARDLTTNFTD